MEVVEGVYRQYTVVQDGPNGLPEVQVEIHYEVLKDFVFLLFL